MGEPKLVKDLKEDFVSRDLGKDKAITLVRSPKRYFHHAVSRSTLLSRECHSKLKLGI